MYDALANIDADQLAADLLKAGKEKVPDYAFDCQRPPSLLAHPPTALFPSAASALRVALGAS